MKYCSHCGRKLFDEAVICPGCGCAAGNVNTAGNLYGNNGGGSVNNAAAVFNYENAADLIGKLSERIKANGIIWIVIASLQILFGLAFVIINLGIGLIPLIVGILNLIGGIKDISYSKNIFLNPTGITAKFQPITGMILTALYNLFIGGVVGIAGSLYYALAIRQFVMDNKEAFDVIDRVYSQKSFAVRQTSSLY